MSAETKRVSQAELDAAVETLARATLDEVDVASLLTPDGPLSIVCRACEKLSGSEAEDSTWRRPRSRGKAGQAKPSGDDEEPTMHRIAVLCPSQHRLIKFNTPAAAYSCDVCRRSQKANTTMHGCRKCNWDACVPCHGKLFSKLKQERDRLAAEQQAAKPPEPAAEELVLPDGLGSALLNCFGELRSDVNVARVLVEIAYYLSSHVEQRTDALRDSVVITTNDNMADSTVGKFGCAALHNLLSGEKELPESEIGIIIDLARTALATHSDDAAVVAKVIGMLLSLHDNSLTCKQSVFSSSLGPVVLNGMRKFVESQEVIEKGCAMIARIAPTLDDPELLSFVIDSVLSTKLGQNAGICEQAYATAIALCLAHHPNDLVATVARCSSARFNRP